MRRAGRLGEETKAGEDGDGIVGFDIGTSGVAVADAATSASDILRSASGLGSLRLRPAVSTEAAPSAGLDPVANCVSRRGGEGIAIGCLPSAVKPTSEQQPLVLYRLSHQTTDDRLW